MSSTALSKSERPTNSLPSGKGLLTWIKPIFTSTVGCKFLVALTGWALTAFVIVHMLGNLQIFLGPEALNKYAKMLKDLAALLWTARLGLLTVFVLHIALSIRLKFLSMEARPVGYSFKKTVQASLASRTMVLTGLVILAFVIFHIAHYTLGVVQTTTIDGKTVGLLDLKDPANSSQHDVYRMTIIGFQNPLIAILYIIAQLILMMHLSHGVTSTFQTLGLNTPRLQSTWRIVGWAVTLLVGVGNIAIVAAVWAGLLK